MHLPLDRKTARSLSSRVVCVKFERKGAERCQVYIFELVETPEYLRQLILYIHLNPVTAGIVHRPLDFFTWSGHRELVRKVRNPFVDPDHLLLALDEARRSARKIYLASSPPDETEPLLALA